MVVEIARQVADPSAVPRRRTIGGASTGAEKRRRPRGRDRALKPARRRAGTATRTGAVRPRPPAAAIIGSSRRSTAVARGQSHTPDAFVVQVRERLRRRRRPRGRALERMCGVLAFVLHLECDAESDPNARLIGALRDRSPIVLRRLGDARELQANAALRDSDLDARRMRRGRDGERVGSLRHATHALEHARQQQRERQTARHAREPVVALQQRIVVAPGDHREARGHAPQLDVVRRKPQRQGDLGRGFRTRARRVEREGQIRAQLDAARIHGERAPIERHGRRRCARAKLDVACRLQCVDMRGCRVQNAGQNGPRRVERAVDASERARSSARAMSFAKGRKGEGARCRSSDGRRPRYHAHSTPQ